MPKCQFIPIAWFRDSAEWTAETGLPALAYSYSAFVNMRQGGDRRETQRADGDRRLRSLREMAKRDGFRAAFLAGTRQQASPNSGNFAPAT